MRKILSFCVCLSAIMVASCSNVEPITEDRLPSLGPNQGMAAIAFTASSGVSGVRIKPVTGTGKTLYISSLPDGDSVFLFVTDAGRYCLDHYSAGASSYDSVKHDQCFDVEAGKMVYGGMYQPLSGFTIIVKGSGIDNGMIEADNWPGFMRLMHERYPNIAASAVPTESDRSVAELARPAPTAPSSDICDLMTTEQASELLGKDVKPGTEWKLGNVTSCNYLHSDDESVHIQFQVCSDSDKDLDSTFGNEALMTGGVLQPVQGFPGKAGVANKGHNYELDVALPDRVMTLVVDGTKRDDIVQAMIAAMQRMLPNVKPLPAQPCA